MKVLYFIYYSGLPCWVRSMLRVFQNRGLKIIRPAIKEQSQDSSVSRVTSPWSGGKSDKLQLASHQVQEILSARCWDSFWCPHSLLLMDTGASLSEGKIIRATLITRFQLVQRFRKYGPIPTIVHMPSCCGVHLPFNAGLGAWYGPSILHMSQQFIQTVLLWSVSCIL